MIKIENTESELFEEAYFVIKQNAEIPKRRRKDDMLREASRIVNDRLTPAVGRGSQRAVLLERGLFFTAGALLSGAVSFIISFAGAV